MKYSNQIEKVRENYFTKFLFILNIYKYTLQVVPFHNLFCFYDTYIIHYIHIIFSTNLNTVLFAHIIYKIILYIYIYNVS